MGDHPFTDEDLAELETAPAGDTYQPDYEDDLFARLRSGRPVFLHQVA